MPGFARAMTFILRLKPIWAFANEATVDQNRITRRPHLGPLIAGHCHRPNVRVERLSNTRSASFVRTMNYLKDATPVREFVYRHSPGSGLAGLPHLGLGVQIRTQGQN